MRSHLSHTDEQNTTLKHTRTLSMISDRSDLSEGNTMVASCELSESNDCEVGIQPVSKPQEEYAVPKFTSEASPLPTSTTGSTTKNIPGESRRVSFADSGRRVSFDHVAIRQYPMVMGDNPCVVCGTPVGLGWEYVELPKLDLDAYENARCKQRRTLRNLILNFYHRQAILERLGYTEQEQDQAAKEAKKIRWQRCCTAVLSPASKLEEIAQSAKRKINRRLRPDPPSTSPPKKSSGSTEIGTDSETLFEVPVNGSPESGCEDAATTSSESCLKAKRRSGQCSSFSGAKDSQNNTNKRFVWFRTRSRSQTTS